MSDPRANSFERNVERPVAIVRSALRMLVGAGLAIAVVLKLYMLLLTDLSCAADEATLGAMIRCADSLELAGYALAVAAAIDVAAGLFVKDGYPPRDALIFGVTAALFFALTAQIGGMVDWRLSLAIATLVAAFLALNIRMKGRLFDAEGGG